MATERSQRTSWQPIASRRPSTASSPSIDMHVIAAEVKGLAGASGTETKDRDTNCRATKARPVSRQSVVVAVCRPVGRYSRRRLAAAAAAATLVILVVVGLVARPKLSWPSRVPPGAPPVCSDGDDVLEHFRERKLRWQQHRPWTAALHSKLVGYAFARSLGVETANVYFCGKLEDLPAQWPAAWGRRLVVKPLDGHSSTGVVLLQDGVDVRSGQIISGGTDYARTVGIFDGARVANVSAERRTALENASLFLWQVPTPRRCMRTCCMYTLLCTLPEACTALSVAATAPVRHGRRDARRSQRQHPGRL